MIVQIARFQKLDARILRGHRVGFGVDPLYEDACEQKIGEDDDPLKAKSHAALQRGCDARMGDAAVGDGTPTETHAFPQHPPDLGDIRIGIRIIGATTDHQQQRL